MYSPIRIFVVDIDQVLIKNHLLDFFIEVFPGKIKKLDSNETLKRIILRTFEVFEFFAMKFGLEYEANNELINFLNYQREEKDAHVFIITDRSRLGINNVIKYLKSLRKDFIQIRTGFLNRKNSKIFQGRNLKTSAIDIHECPWIKPDIRVISGMAPLSQTLIIDDDSTFREIAKKHGYQVILGDYDCINDSKWFTLLLKRKVKWMHDMASRA